MVKPGLRRLACIIIQKHKNKVHHTQAIRYAYPIVIGIPSQVKVQVFPAGQLRSSASTSFLLFPKLSFTHFGSSQMTGGVGVG
jgi:hypothetical protein